MDVPVSSTPSHPLLLTTFRVNTVYVNIFDVSSSSGTPFGFFVLREKKIWQEKLFFLKSINEQMTPLALMFSLSE